MQSGYVYILTNESFREDWVKIGKSSRPVDVRSKELDNTAVPLPFTIYATLQTSKYHEVEKLVHSMIDELTDLRIRQNREFFNVAPEMALSIFQRVATLIDDAVIRTYENNKVVRVYKKGDTIPIDVTGGHKPPVKRSKHFTFAMVGIPIGSELTFTAAGMTVVVATPNKIEYDGRAYSLSAFVGTFMPVEKQNSSCSYNPTKYFTYKGETLAAMRARIEAGDGGASGGLAAQPPAGNTKGEGGEGGGTSTGSTGQAEGSGDTPAGDGTGPTKRRSPKPRFRFDMVDIPVGSMIRFDPTGVEVRVASHNTVEYEGETYLLSPFVTKFMPPERRQPAGAYQGPLYFSYKGKVLNDLRKEFEKANESLIIHSDQTDDQEEA